MRCSVIIPAYNSEATVAFCLESALNQSLSKEDYEVILVDDGSMDDTRKIAENYPIRVTQQEKQGPAAARNNGATQAKGDILIFTDSDCELDFNFIENIIAPFGQDSNIVGVQGSYKTKQKEFVAQFVQVEIETRYQKMAKSEYTDFIGTYAAAYRKDIFLRYGGFDVGFTLASGEDTEFSYKLHAHNHKMVFEPKAFVYHQHPSNLRRYLKMKFFRGYWRVRLYRKHPKKVIKDSYTPQFLKFQVLAIPLSLLFAFLSLFNIIWLLILFFIILLFVVFSIPFFKLFKEKKHSKAILIPAMLLLRGLFLFLGIVSGAVDTLRNTNPSPKTDIIRAGT